MYKVLIVALLGWSALLQIQPSKESMMSPVELVENPNLYVLELDKVVASEGAFFCLMGKDREWGVLMRENVFLGLNLPYRKGLTEGVYTCKYYSDVMGLGPWERRQRTFL